jgi:glycosyltransferase involved in cell wall biosynthesis
LAPAGADARVLHVCAYYAPAWVYGGPPRTIHGLCSALRRLGADVEVFTTDANGEEALAPSVTTARSYQGVPVRYFPRSWPMQPVGSRALTRALREALRRADVLHIHGLWNRVVWAAAREARRAGVPYILSPRGMLEDAALAHHSWRKRAAYTLLERRTVQDAARLHATSDREAAGISRLLPAANIVCIPNGIDARNASRDGGRRQDGPSILFVGRVHPIKRLDLLIDAFILVRAEYPNARLVIAGPDEMGLRRELTARAGNAALSIQWAGQVTDAQRDTLLAEASALVLCSDSESFGLSVLEAMSAGVPVVVTETCGWDEVGSHGAGLVVPQRADAIASALGRIIQYPVQAAEMSHRGQALVERRYRWETIARAFMQTYGEVAAERKALAATS